MEGGTELELELERACVDAMRFAESNVFPFKQDTEAEIAAVRAQLDSLSPADRRVAELVLVQAEAEVAVMEAALRSTVKTVRHSKKMLKATKSQHAPLPATAP